MSLALKKHSESREHNFNVNKSSDWTWCQKEGNVQQMLDPKQVDEAFVERNRAHLLTMLDIVLFCAKQEIPLRGSDESKYSKNKGNFLELNQLLQKYSPDMKKRFDALPANSKMINHEIQNDLLESANEVILDLIMAEISGEEYVILADEAKSLNKKENVAVAMRYEKNGVIKERVIGFVEPEGLEATEISNSIISLVNKLQLLPENCVGLGFDGASVMSGESAGVQAILRVKYTNAIYVHCASHRLNLVLNTVCENVTEVKDFFELLNELPTFMSGSKRHKIFLDIQKKLGHGKVKELVHPSPTRWLSRDRCVDALLTRFDAVLQTLELLLGESSGAGKTVMQGLLNRMENKTFVFLLVFFGKLFESMSFATEGLQKTLISVDRAHDFIEILKDDLEEMLNEVGTFENVCLLVEDICQKQQIQNFHWRSSRVTRLPAFLQDTDIGDISFGRRSHIAKKEDWMEKILRPTLKCQLSELKRRFDSKHFDIMSCAYSVTSESDSVSDDSFLPEDACERVTNLFGIEKVDGAEKRIFRRLLTRVRDKDADHTKAWDLLSVLIECDKDIFPTVHRLLKILVTLPVTTCSVERFFSTLRRVGTYNRTTMLTSRFSNLCVLSFEKELVQEIDKMKVIEKFKRKARRLLL